MLVSFSYHILSIAVAWRVYEITKSPLSLGLVGLAQFLPALLLVFATGAAADRFDRRWVMGWAAFVIAACAATLLALVVTDVRLFWPFFVTLLVLGCGRAFYGPAAQSLVPNLVPEEHLPNAIALTASSNQLAAVTGPALGGLLYALAPASAFFTSISCLAIGIFSISRIPKHTLVEKAQMSLKSLAAGFSYIWRDKILLGVILLDLFAVLFGGVTALLPIYASDILKLDAWGFGILRAAPGVGALLAAIYLARSPIKDHAGIVMLCFVAAYGTLTVLFSVSTIAALSLLALFAMGACDMVSVYIRQTLVQVWTPDGLRGRVNGVNMVFIGASNELGDLRAGTMAALIGVMPAALVGGLGTITVAALWSKLFPGLKNARYLHKQR